MARARKNVTSVLLLLRLLVAVVMLVTFLAEPTESIPRSFSKLLAGKSSLSGWLQTGRETGSHRSKRSLPTSAEKQQLLDKHNALRKLQGASNMHKLKWNDELASMASEWTELCKYAHGQPDRSPPPYSWIGQNIYISGGVNIDLEGATQLWYDEISQYDYANLACSGTCGHYTQVVWADTKEIGCGYQVCDKLEGATDSQAHIIVCNYGPGGNYDDVKPYLKGTACSACPADAQFCDDELCTDVSPCSNQCLNGGQVNSNCGCDCVNGYTGDTCGVDPCASTKCQNGGNVQNNNEACSCNCVNGYTGDNCEVEPCANTNCLNGGQVNSNCGCDCVNGYTGDTCEVDPCASTKCQNGGNVQNNNGACSCNCVNGYTGDKCEVEPCANTNCLNGGQVNSNCGCDCVNGYTGDTCEVDPCASTKCQNGGNVQNNNGACSCNCVNGYTGDNCEVAPCSDTNCLNGGSAQSNDGVCTCECVNGYTGDSCEVDPCESVNCLNGGNVQNNNGDCTCNCVNGYTGDTCEVDPCASVNCLNGGSVQNNNGDCTCNCVNGYTGDTCEVDPCGSHKCLNGGTVLNNNGECSCNCADGFTGSNCADAETACSGVPCENGELEESSSGTCECKCSDNWQGDACDQSVPEARLGVQISMKIPIDLWTTLWPLVRPLVTNEINKHCNKVPHECCDNVNTDWVSAIYRQYMEDSELRVGSGFPSQQGELVKALVYAVVPQTNELCTAGVAGARRRRRRRRETIETAFSQDALYEVIQGLAANISEILAPYNATYEGATLGQIEVQGSGDGDEEEIDVWIFGLVGGLVALIIIDVIALVIFTLRGRKIRQQHKYKEKIPNHRGDL